MPTLSPPSPSGTSFWRVTADPVHINKMQNELNNLASYAYEGDYSYYKQGERAYNQAVYYIAESKKLLAAQTP